MGSYIRNKLGIQTPTPTDEKEEPDGTETDKTGGAEDENTEKQKEPPRKVFLFLINIYWGELFEKEFVKI